MTEVAQYEKPVSVVALANRVSGIVSWTIGIIGLIVGAVLISICCHNADIGYKVHNTLKHDGWWAVGMILGTIIWGIFCIPLAELIDQKVPSWDHKVFGASPVKLPLFLALVCIFPPMYFCVYESIPARLGTPEGYLRIMEDGREIMYGEILPTNRSVADSKVVPIHSRSSLSFVAAPRNGFSTAITLQADLTLEPGENSRRVLSSMYSNLPYWSSGIAYVESDTAQIPEPIAALLAAQLEPIGNQLVPELEQQKDSGSASALIIRSRQVAEIQNLKLDSWIKKLTVSNVAVSSWSKEHN